jgi:LPS-assembly protein
MRGAAIMLVVIALAAIIAPSRGQAAPPSRAKQDESTPVLVTADELQYDQARGLTIAKGHVELSQRQQILLADTVTYDQRTDTVTASGHVSLMQADGDVVFADFMELHDDFRDGFIKDVRLLLSDGSRMAGNTARRVDGIRTEVRRGVYSPCELCAKDPTHPPVWQIKAEQITDDKELKLVEYRDAVMEIEGIPIFWTPYMSHPDPSVKRASGFLPPVVGNDASNGFRIGIPYYQVLGPDKDATFRPIFTTEGGTVLDGQYRQRFSNGFLATDSSVTLGSRTIDPRISTVAASSSGVRGHLQADGLWDLDDRWRVGLNSLATTDQSYLQRYHFNYTTNYLSDHLYTENFGRASYGNISAYAFQNLNPTYSIANEPIVLPVASYTLTTPVDEIGGRWQVTGNALNLMAPHTGFRERRLSAGTSWRLPFNGPIGDVYQFTASLRGDGYDSDLTPAAGFSQNETKAAGRIFPQVALKWRYPLIRPSDTFTTLIEPIAAIFAAPLGGNPAAIPNEDAQSFEFDDSDLFRVNRFPGLDRVDGGQRVDYGIHAGVYNPVAGSTQVLIGESYRFQRQTAFPFGAGLDHRRSDVVGRLQISPGGYFDMFYRARVDGRDLAMRRQEVGISGGPANLTASVSYIATSTIPGVPSVLPARQISTTITAQLTPNWSAQVTHTQNLNNGSSSLNSALQITYRDDCLAVTGTIRRSGISFGDLRAGTSFVLTFVFKNLGDVSVQPFGF